MVWRVEDPQGSESQKVRWDVVPFTRGVGIDLGCGPTKLFPIKNVIGVDNGVDTELFGIAMQPDVRITDASNLPFETEALDFVFSSHMLEHVVDPLAVLREAWRCLKPGGYLVLYLPHADHYPRMGEPGANPDHKHDFTPGRVITLLTQAVGTGLTLIVDEDRVDDMEYSFLLVARKEADGHIGPMDPQQWFGHRTMRMAGKTACVVRYGGFGDQIQASNILPELKRQGYHVTFMTTPKGQEILRHDPHIDTWFIQDNDQVPNGELVDFWKWHEARFDRFINLSESIEGTLLALPGRSNHRWPDAVRRREMGRNYLEWTAELAELPYTSEAAFYPTEQEHQTANDYLAFIACGNRKPAVFEAVPKVATLLWVLAGSSVHKFYPGQDLVIINLLRAYPDLHIIFSGDAACVILEAGWENHPRVHCTSGEMTIRQTLTLAQVVDIVVGPETGVLNAVGFHPNAKVVLLSHSSAENLTKHWTNTRAVVPFNTPCYPCHRLHYTREFCPRDEATGAAACQVSIAPAVVFEAIVDSLVDAPTVRRERLRTAKVIQISHARSA